MLMQQIKKEQHAAVNWRIIHLNLRGMGVCLCLTKLSEKPKTHLPAKKIVGALQSRVDC